MRAWILRLNPAPLVGIAALAGGVGLAVSAYGQMASRPQAPPAAAATMDRVAFQQSEITSLEARLKAQQQQIDALKATMDEERAQQTPAGYSAAFGTKAVFLQEASDVAVTYYVPIHRR